MQQHDKLTWYARPGYAHADKPEQGLYGLAAFFAKRAERLARRDADATAREAAEREQEPDAAASDS